MAETHVCACAEQRRPQIALGPKPNQQQPQRLTLAVRHLPQPIDGPHLDVRKTLLRHHGDMVDATVAVLVRGEKEGVFVALQWLTCQVFAQERGTMAAQRAWTWILTLGKQHPPAMPQQHPSKSFREGQGVGYGCAPSSVNHEPGNGEDHLRLGH